MVRRINIDQSLDLPSDSELARMLNELCWTIDQRNPLLLIQNGNPHFHVIAAFVLPDSKIAIVNTEHATMKFFKIQISRNLNQYQTTRAQYALQALRIAFFAGQAVVEQGMVVSITYTPYDSNIHSTVGNDLLALGFAGGDVMAIRRAFERRELYCEVTDDHGNVLQGMIPPQPNSATRRQYFTGRNVMQVLGSMAE
ncbi:hypothetical protein H4I96_12067 [Botrytis cinerea]